jgi:hypothetical protein
MKGYRGTEAVAHPIPGVALDSDEWTASRPGLFIFPTTYCIEGWLCSRLGVDSLEKR